MHPEDERAPLAYGRSAAGSPRRCSPRVFLTVAIAVLLLTNVVTLALLLSGVARGAGDAGDAGDDGGSVVPPPPPSSSPFSSLGGFCDGVPPIGAAERATRVAALRAALRDAGSEPNALLLEPGSSLEYLVGGGAAAWSLSERPFVAVVDGRAGADAWGGVSWVCPAFEARRARAVLPAGGAARLFLWAEHEPWTWALERALRLNATGATNATLAIERSVRYFVADAVRTSASLSAAGVSLAQGVDTGGAVVDALRQVKSTTELAIMSCVNRATKAALALLQQHVAVGMTQSEVEGMCADALSAAGLSKTWYLVLGGPDASYPHGTSQNRALQQGDLLLLDIGGDLLGYQSDISRTFVVEGTVPQVQLDAWQVVRQAQQAALALIRPGVDAAAVEAAARAVVTQAGFGANYEFFTHRLGHGIGLDGHEAPYLVRGNNATLLQEGMTFSVEPGIYVEGEYGIRLEDIAVVTATGVDVFGPLPPANPQDPLARQ